MHYVANSLKQSTDGDIYLPKISIHIIDYVKPMLNEDKFLIFTSKGPLP